MAHNDTKRRPLLPSKTTILADEFDSSALEHQRVEQCVACVDRLEMMALKSLGVKKKDPRSRAIARKHVRMAECFYSSRQSYVWQKLNQLHQFSQYLQNLACYAHPYSHCLADVARHRRCSKTRHVVYFRLADGQTVKIDNRKDKQLPERLQTLYLHTVESPPDGWESLVPYGWNKTGWESWTISKHLCAHIHQVCGVDVSRLTANIELSQAFPISADSHAVKFNEIADTFSFSYPHPQFAEELHDIKQEQIDAYPILALLKYGGFMYFKCNTREERCEKWRRHCITHCITPKAAFFDLVDVKAVSLEGDRNQGAVALNFGFAHLYQFQDAAQFLDRKQPITIPQLREQGVTHFKWIAPQERLGCEPMPCGFPNGGFAYLVEESQDNKKQDEAVEKVAGEELKELNSGWWQIHLKALTDSVVLQHKADRKYKTELCSKIESLAEPHEEDDWEERFKRAQVITNIFLQLRYAFNVPMTESRLWQIYFIIFSFRLSFALLMSLLLTVAAYLGVQMQIFFTVFGAMYQAHECPSIFCRLVFGFLPILMVLFALVVDQLVDLVSDALTPPAFMGTQAKLLAVLSICEPHNKPGRYACLIVDALGFFGCEFLPDFGAIYNFYGVWSGDWLPHYFYMGHRGYGEAILGGYITGHLYFCFGITIILTFCDVLCEFIDYGRKARESIYWPMQTIERALKEHMVRPYFTRIHRHMFHKAFYQGEEVDEVGLLVEPHREYMSSPRAQTGQKDEEEQFGSMETYYVEERDASSNAKCLGWLLSSISWTCNLTPWILVCYVMGVFHLSDKAPLVQWESLSWWLWANSETSVVSHFLILASASLVLGVVGVAYKLKTTFPNLVGAPFYGFLVITSILTSSLLYEGQGFSPKGGAHESMSPLMTLVNEQGPLHGGLPTWWPNPAVAQEYPICRMGWGATTAQVSSLELGALSYISYSTNCSGDSSSVSGLLNQSFFPAPELVQCKNYSEIPRWIAVRFQGKSKDDEDTIVVAVKGTSTVADGYLDTDLFTTIEVLQLFSFMAPVLMVVPKNMIIWLLAELKVIAVGRGSVYEQNIWNSLTSEIRELQSNNTKSKIVLTGHSLGGGIAEIVAARLGLPALVWSAPGAMYLQRFYNITEEQEQRDVVVVVPDFDYVPRVDEHTAVVQRIQCWAKNHQVENPLTCHSIAKSSCEVWRVCGDDKRRNFNNTCFPFINNNELGTLYPVLNAPINAKQQ